MSHKWSTTAACLALVVGLAACGGGIEPRAPEDGASALSDAASNADGDAVVTAGGSNGEGAVAVLQETVERTSTVDSGRYEMVIMYDAASTPDFPTQQVQMTGEFAEAGQRLHVTMTTTPDTGSGFEETVVDGTAYIDVPSVGCQSVDLSGLLDELASSGGSAVTDPSAMLDLLSGVGDGVSEEGTLDIRGVPTTHYAGTYTARAALEQARGDQAEVLDQMFAGMPDSFLEAEQQVDVFIDDEGLLRRMQIASPGVEVSGVAVPSYTTIVDYFDFGADVAIEAPTDCSDGFSPVGTQIN